MKENLEEKLELPAGVSAQQQGFILTIKGPKGEVSRLFHHPEVKISIEGKAIVLRAEKATKREKAQLQTFLAHIKNMALGVQQPFVYKLKICSGHFPMSVTASGKEFVVKNFLGESVPRKMSLPEGVEVKIAGTDIEVKSADKEVAGLTAARIEILCKITNRDIRIFQDGCYITEKAGKGVLA